MDKACPLNQFQGQLKKLKRINAYREFISMMWSLDLINDSGHIHHKYINENKRIESEIIILDQRFADRYSWSFVIVGIYDILFNFVLNKWWNESVIDVPVLHSSRTHNSKALQVNEYMMSWYLLIYHVQVNGTIVYYLLFCGIEEGMTNKVQILKRRYRSTSSLHTRRACRILVDLYCQGERPTRSPTQRYVIW